MLGRLRTSALAARARRELSDDVRVVAQLQGIGRQEPHEGALLWLADFLRRSVVAGHFSSASSLCLHSLTLVWSRARSHRVDITTTAPHAPRARSFFRPRPQHVRQRGIPACRARRRLARIDFDARIDTYRSGNTGTMSGFVAPGGNRGGIAVNGVVGPIQQPGQGCWLTLCGVLRRG